jgi:glycosyltransferase involved in cell wall biosynthesis
MVLKVLQAIERFLLKKVDIIIHASRFFKGLYNNYYGIQIILENKPVFPNNNLIRNKSDRFVISFIGSVRYFEILKNLIDAIQEFDNIDLYIHGEGIDSERVEKYSRDKKNVYITGRYNHKEISGLYLSSDVVWAVYPSNDFNVKFAISNKFHESLLFETPCIYASGTMLGEFVKKENLGLIVDPYSVKDIKMSLSILINNQEVLSNIIHSIRDFSKNETSWEDDFAKIVNEINLKFNK